MYDQHRIAEPLVLIPNVFIPVGYGGCGCTFSLTDLRRIESTRNYRSAFSTVQNTPLLGNWQSLMKKYWQFLYCNNAVKIIYNASKFLFLDSQLISRLFVNHNVPFLWLHFDPLPCNCFYIFQHNLHVHIARTFYCVGSVQPGSTPWPAIPLHTESRVAYWL